MPEERWLITGASGQLGSHVVRQLAIGREDGTVLGLAGRHEVTAAGVAVQHVDLADFDALRAVVTGFRPTHVVHLGAITSVAACHAQPADAQRVNAEATGVLAEMAADRFVFASTDMVFNGEAAPYQESDPPCPTSQYGRSKLAAERLLAGFEQALIVRLPLMYGLPCSLRETTFAKQIAALRSGQPLRLFTDEFRTPAWLADVAQAIIGLARSELTGLIHVGGPERLSRYELIERSAALLGTVRPNLQPASRHDAEAAEPRPADLALDSARLVSLFPELAPGPIRAEVFTSP